jgi:uncharacterized protein
LKVAVISDTHVRYFKELPSNLLSKLSRADLIIHAGDIVTMDVIKGLETLAPVKGVCGNMDQPDVRAVLPEQQVMEIEGKKLAVIHGSGSPWMLEERILKDFPGFDLIIFGHSHIALNKKKNGTLLFNPGSAHDSYGLLDIGEDVAGTIINDY